MPGLATGVRVQVPVFVTASSPNMEIGFGAANGDMHVDGSKGRRWPRYFVRQRERGASFVGENVFDDAESWIEEPEARARGDGAKSIYQEPVGGPTHSPQEGPSRFLEGVWTCPWSGGAGICHGVSAFIRGTRGRVPFIRASRGCLTTCWVHSRSSSSKQASAASLGATVSGLSTV